LIHNYLNNYAYPYQIVDLLFNTPYGDQSPYCPENNPSTLYEIFYVIQINIAYTF